MIMAKLDIRRFGMALKPWNDDRPMTPRIVVGERSVDSRGMSLRFATERIERTTDWCCHDSSRHLIYVHRMVHGDQPGLGADRSHTATHR